MNEFVNRKVTSDRFGDGLIISQTKTTLSINFPADRIREFEYPSCLKQGIVTLVSDESGEVESAEDVLASAKLSPAPCHGQDYTAQTFTCVSDFISVFNAALEREKNELKNQGGRHSRLFDGKLIEGKNGRYLYSFESDSEQHFPDDTPISIWINDLQFSATLLSAVEWTVIIAVHEDFGPDIKSLEFSAEPWQLLEELQNRLTEIEFAPSKIVKKIVCNDPATRNEDGRAAINLGSDKAIESAVTNDITFVWGPPGTGKTETLAKIALRHINNSQRVLMLSYSNVSVDGAILRVRKLDDYFSPGRLLRYGYPREKKLLDDEALTSYNLALNAYPELKQRRNNLLAERKKVDRNSARFVEINQLLGDIRDELETQEKALVAKASFIATTISKTVVDKLLYEGHFDVVLFDEASMAFIPQVVFAASLAKRHFICLGDFNQLPPISQTNEECLGWDIFQYCGITNAVQRKIGHQWLYLLDTQYRMHPQIAKFSSKGMYSSLIKSAPDMAKRRAKIVNERPFAEKPMYLVDLSGMMTVCKLTTDKSHMNALSALIAFGIALEAAQRNDVGIIAPYSSQAKLFNAMSRDAAQAFPDLHRIHAATVHQFQGSEKDIIIYDTVDCYRQPYIGKMLTLQANNYANRLFNVAITRSKGKFIAVSNVEFFKNKHLSNNLLLGQFLLKYRLAGQFIAGGKVKNVFTDRIKDMYHYYDDCNGLEDFEHDLDKAKNSVFIDIPEGVRVDDNLLRIANKITAAKERGVDAVVRAVSVSELPSELRQITIRNDFAWNPIAVIDRSIIWFGMPYSEAMFISNNEQLESTCHPVIRFAGTYTAGSLLGFLEMNKNSGSTPLEVDEDAGKTSIKKFLEQLHSCPACGNKMKLRQAKHNRKVFLGCSQYPTCQEIVNIDLYEVELYLRIDEEHRHCKTCGSELKAKAGRHGIYLQCSNDTMHRFSLL